VPMLAAMCTLRLQPSPSWAKLCCKAMAAGMAAPTGPAKLGPPKKSRASAGGARAGSSPAAAAAAAPPSAPPPPAESGGTEGGTESGAVRYDPEQLSSAARSLALLGVVPGPAWARAYLLACYGCWEGFGPRQWVDLMWALAKMQVRWAFGRGGTRRVGGREVGGLGGEGRGAALHGHPTNQFCLQSCCRLDQKCT
jgi:hypothetical protein